LPFWQTFAANTGKLNVSKLDPQLLGTLHYSWHK
jgi:hypothetical protein